MADRARLAKRPIMPPKRREFTWKMESSRGSWKVEVVCQPTKEGRKQGNSQSPEKWVKRPALSFLRAKLIQVILGQVSMESTQINDNQLG